MMKVTNILGIVPARGGSKGVPRKNIRTLLGKPLIAYTIEEARKSKHLSTLIVSTEDEEIAQIARTYGAEVPFVRPKELASDTARAIDVIRHALETMEERDRTTYDLVVYLEPPTPLRMVEDIDSAIKLFFKEDPDSVVSVVEANQFHPILMKKIVDGRLHCMWKEEPEGVPRQLYEPKAYMRNGAVYIFRKSNIMKGTMYGKDILPYIMPVERSVCIDDMNDWYAAEAWMARRGS